MRQFLFLAAIFFPSIRICAEIRVGGEVCNALTQEGVARAVVRLLSAEGDTVFATDTTRYRLITERGSNWTTVYPDKHSGAEFSVVVAKRAAYMLVIEAEGFDEYRCRLVPEEKKTVVSVSPVYLVPRAKDRRLGEAVVKGTRIKMFYKGDTLIYNADAFNVTQNESLRKLVQQLPGAELNDGEIRINGKRVDNLLISGKDFFNGNIQSALDNLPAYIVSRIKVYDKVGEQSELTGRDMHDENYVLDVHLKRQYLGVWMAKLSADAGSERRWGGQGFLMRFDDRQMFTVNADVNNFNMNREMADICNMAEVSPSGKITNKVVRLSYYFEPDKTWRFTAGGSISRKDTDKSSWKNEQTFLSPANLMRRSEESFEGKDVAATATAGVRARKSGHWQHNLNYNIDFARSRSIQDSRSLSYYLPSKALWEGISLDSIIRLEEAKGEENALLHSLLDPRLLRSRSFNQHPEWKSSFVFGADLLNVDVGLKHNVQTQREFSNYRLKTYADNVLDAHRRYKYRCDYALDFNPQVEWVHKYERLKQYDGVFTPFLCYTHRRATANHPEYRLERMTEWADRQGWGLAGLGCLPEGEWQSLCLSEANSYYSVENKEKAEVGLRLSHKVFLRRGSFLQIDGDLSVYYQDITLDYDREGQRYSPRRDGFFFKPTLALKWKYEKSEGHKWLPEWEAKYSGLPAMPSLLQLLPVRDASDPLNLFVGNETLGNSFTHQVNSAYRLRHTESGCSWNIETTYRRLHNDIATRSVYDSATGIRTYQPVNTSRTHVLQARTEYSTPLDVKKRFFFSVSMSADYYQAENYSFLNDVNAAAGLLRNVGLTPEMSLRATIGSDFRFYGRCRTAFRRVSQYGNENNYRETNLYGDISYILPWGVQLSTITNLIFYAGNSQASLNNTVTKWDLSFSKYFLDERLGVHFKIHDLLNSANNYSSEVIATGRIESYTDVLPRYFMLTLNYRFDWVGKK